MKLVCVASPLSTQHKGARSNWLARNQDNVSEWSDMSTRRLFQWSRTMNPTRRVLVCAKRTYSAWPSWTSAHLALNNNDCLTRMKFIYQHTSSYSKARVLGPERVTGTHLSKRIIKWKSLTYIHDSRSLSWLTTISRSVAIMKFPFLYIAPSQEKKKQTFTRIFTYLRRPY